VFLNICGPLHSDELLDPILVAFSYRETSKKVQFILLLVITVLTTAVPFTFVHIVHSQCLIACSTGKTEIRWTFP